MSFRIAVIGTSHAAALKSAWDEIGSRHLGVRLTFFAARNRPEANIAQLRPEGGKLVAEHPDLVESLMTTSGGLREIDPALYDAILLVGFRPRPVLPPPLMPYSAAVRTAIYETARDTGDLSMLVGQIRAVAPNRPLFAAALPLLADVPEKETPASGLYETSLREMDRVLHTPLGVTLLPQPRQTILGNRWTDPAYSRGSQRLQKNRDGKTPEPHPENDVIHMNAAYGKLVLAEAIPAIGAVTPSGSQV